MRYFLVFALLAFMCATVVTAQAGTVERLRVEGTKRLDAATVEFYAKVTLPGELAATDVDAVLKNLYATSLFKKVDVTVVDEELVVTVEENPIVRNIILKGNHVFSDKNLENDVLKLKKMSVYTEAKLERDLANLHALYQSRGLLGVNVTHAVVPAPRNYVDIIIKVEEGATTRIKNILFVGNDTFSDVELKNVIASKERSLTDIFGFFGNSTKFFAERLMVDQSLLRDYYTSRGYLDFKVRSTTTEVGSNLAEATVIFSLEEGKKYHFGTATVTIDDGPITKEEEEHRLANMILTREGEVFDMSLVERTAALLTAYLNERGNLFATVKNDYTIKDDAVNVAYKVSLGQSVYVRRINIAGNTRTLDVVLRRKLGISEGDVYSTFAMKQSRKKLMNLDFFETVDVNTQKISERLVDLNFTVKERGTGSFDIGAGFSPASGLVGKVSIKERNLMGTGKVVAFDLMRSLTGMSSTLDLVTPDIFDSEVSFGIGSFYSRQGSAPAKSLGGLFPSDSPFSSTNAGFSARLSCSLTDSVAASLQYYYKYHSIHNVGNSASKYIKEQEGVHFDSSVGYSLLYSSIDNPYKPKRGTMIRMSQSVSGVGGNLHYVKTEVSSAHVYHVLRRFHDEITLKVKPSFGYVFAYAGEHVKIGQRFFMGNSEIRGFSSSGIGPRDIKTGEALGGKLYYGAVTQLDFPIGLPDNLGVRGSLFLDIASLSGLDYKEVEGFRTSDLPRVSVGFGFSWQSPFGPIRVDFGFPIVAEKFDSKDMLRISTDAGL
ncbi:outer membrane protein assembly factor BamA [Candidatus Anaplasma sp. TIGMIC]|uniref:outer membrane protein assembly factor BamA n=1 Tax=Candidatus Anaplasma sp. TIGMIC TaxID=3020713 RepID=UPI00232D5C0E|nr:outer membrane protein assembly factor BamA [Candidatus Anaplasma sp. TIGMIC]MDB1135314.1 outer membrane protein assembly factor BamA [Candidatus Anaplasma sp. TIGMIC]